MPSRNSGHSSPLASGSIHLVQNAPGDSLVAQAETLIAAGISEPAIAAVRNHPSLKKIREGARAVALWPQALKLLKEPKPERIKLQPIVARMFADGGRPEQAPTELDKLSDSAWRSCAADLAETFEMNQRSVAIDLYDQLAEEREAHGTRGARTMAASFKARLTDLGGRNG